MELWLLALVAFLVTVVLVLWRPGGVHEFVPALVGAFVMFLFGLIDRGDVLRVMGVVWNSAMTIISTFVMASVLEATGFFDWMGDRLLERARGSGFRLFHLVLAFSACMTLFLNNDGAILLGTPVILALLRRLQLPRQAEWGYLISACLIASAASPPIGVSNMANLEAMTLVGISLTEHLHNVFFPAVLGLAVCWGLLRFLVGRHLPVTLVMAAQNSATGPLAPLPHPHAVRRLHLPPPPRPPHPPFEFRRPDWVPLPPPPPQQRSDPGFMWFAVGVVVLVRFGFFAASMAGIPTYAVAAAGALLLLAVNARRRAFDARRALTEAPWPILGFAFGMDLVVFGLKNAGLIGLVASALGLVVRLFPSGIGVFTGLLSAAVSAVLNNHPGLIIGALAVQELGVGAPMLHSAYSGVVLGADLGSLLTPVGTLACLLWFHILERHGKRHTWWEFLRITLVVVPASFAVALGALWLQTWLLLR